MEKDSKNKKKIFIWGAGGQGRVVLNVLKKNPTIQVCAFIDSNPKFTGSEIEGIKIIGDKSKLNSLKKDGVNSCIIAVGDNNIRHKLSKEVLSKGFSFINAVDSYAMIDETALIGTNITVWSGAIIYTRSIIHDNVIVSCGAIIEHECVIGEGAHIGPGANLAGRVEVGKRAFVCMGANVIQNIKIGKDAVVGAGAVVLKDVPDKVLVAGVPAKVIKKL
jgi:UDP-perosamine 4-acetyltransferase